MLTKAIQMIKDEREKKDITSVSTGDSVKVHVRIKEGEKERVQIFTGTVISRKSSGINE